MDQKQAIGLVALAWLVGSVFLMARLIRRGRKLVSTLARKFPDTYEEIGRPQPGFFESARRRRFSQFLAKKEYLSLIDANLAAEFEDYKKAENRLLVSVLATLGIVGGLILWVSRGT